MAKVQKLIGTPDQVFHESSELSTLIDFVDGELKKGSRSIKQTFTLPDDFIDKLKSHFKRSGWTVEWDETKREFNFTVKKGWW